MPGNARKRGRRTAGKRRFPLVNEGKLWYDKAGTFSADSPRNILAYVPGYFNRNIEEGCQAVVKYKDLIVEPDEARHRAYEEYYQLYKDTYEASKDVLQRVTLMGRRQ